MKGLNVFDRLNITHIIAIWLFGIVLFGALYFGLTLTNQPLMYNDKPITSDVIGFGNSIYFSFITALTIGYNDITPTGLAKLANKCFNTPIDLDYKIIQSKEFSDGLKAPHKKECGSYWAEFCI